MNPQTKTSVLKQLDASFTNSDTAASLSARAAHSLMDSVVGLMKELSPFSQPLMMPSLCPFPRDGELGDVWPLLHARLTQRTSSPTTARRRRKPSQECQAMMMGSVDTARKTPREPLARPSRTDTRPPKRWTNCQRALDTPCLSSGPASLGRLRAPGHHPNSTGRIERIEHIAEQYASF